ncbi:MAG: sigma-70 family RNA polymerase sigma factor [Draconibacterium sp.]
MNSDRKIWNDFRCGENYALSYIYYQYVQFLFRYGKKITDNENLVKDTIQDLFVNLIRTRENLGETDNIRFYLLRSFRRMLLKNIRNQNSIFSSLSEEDLLPEIIYSAEQDFIEKEQENHQNEVIKKALQQISPKQREILFYRFTCEFEYDQICELMSLKYDSARKQVFRAIKALKGVMTDVNIILFLFPVMSSSKKSQKNN